jgi:hypothetical protein
MSSKEKRCPDQSVMFSPVVFGISLTDADRELFLQTLAHVVFRYSWICHVYCLMANHFHLLIETPKANLSIGTR